ncbi:MAG TPA: glycosyltransferase [Blastocatellia bacterium]|nr:glycosyltransferase [Blastocatellia bacterium]
MNILHVTPSFHPAYVYGGPTRSVYELCRSLNRAGCQVRVLTTDANGPDAVLNIDTTRESDLAGFRVRYCHRIKDVSVSPTLLRLLPEYIRWADVVHLSAVYSFPTIPTLLACRVLRKPVVWSPRGMLQRWEGTTRLALKAIWERVCRVVAPPKLVLHVTSEEEREESLPRLPTVKIEVIPNGIEVFDRIAAVNGHKILRILFLGRLHPQKGIENLLEAYRRIDGCIAMPLSLTIAGAGDLKYTNHLKEEIRQSGLSEKVRMTGAVLGAEKAETLRNTDVVIVPSYKENFAMVVAEALAYGVPVIASTGTPWKRLPEIGCGLWVDNQPESLAQAIRDISRMPLREMGLRGREWMQKEFAGDIIARKMMAVYQSLIERPAPNPTI